MLIDNKLMLFGGKGGVGKTSCAAATALYAASKGKKTLILSTDPAHSLSDSFEKQIENKITKINNNLDALEIDAGELLKDYKEKYGNIIKQIADEGTFFSKQEIQEFFDLSLPGMDELMALIKIIDILKENKYELLILDTAPTGHTIRLLEMPELMEAYVKVLAEMRMKHRVVVRMMIGKYVKDKADEFIEKMQDDIKRVKETLKSAETKFIPITIPEAMSIYETERLIKVLEKHSIKVDEILINRIIKDDCDFCKSKKQEQEKYIDKINKFGYKTRQIPLFANEIKGKDLEILIKILFENLKELPKPKIEIKSTPEIKFDLLKISSNSEFLLFGGKGGVGKTSMASAVALHESKNKKVLIFSTDPANSLSDSFDIKIENKITKINNDLDALEIDSYELLKNLKLKYKKEINEFFSSILKPTTKATIDIPYDRKVMEDLIDLAPPGIDEIMALKTIMDLIEKKQYELLILDTAPTGHTIRLLEMPEIAESWIRTLLDIQESYPFSIELSESLEEMLKTIKKVEEMLKSKNTEFIAVSIPEAMSLLETQDLISSLKKLKVPVEQLIINQIFPKNNCDFCRAKRAEQFEYVKKLQDFKLKTIGIELFKKEIRGIDALESLGNSLFGS